MSRAQICPQIRVLRPSFGIKFGSAWAVNSWSSICNWAKLRAIQRAPFSGGETVPALEVWMLIVRLIILFGLLFGAGFGVVHILRKKAEAKRLGQRQEAESRVRALLESRDKGELGSAECDELTRQIYQACRDKGIEIGDHQP